MRTFARMFTVLYATGGFFSHVAEDNNYYGATDLGAKHKLVTWWKNGSAGNVLVRIFLCLAKKYVSQK